MDDYGVVPETGTVRFERVLPGPIERVWAYLTESEKRGTWLASGPMDLRVGGRVDLRFRHADLPSPAEPTPERSQNDEGEDRVSGRITRCDPPHLLSYTWREEAGDESEVTFELTPHGEEVRLVLTHRRLGDRAAMVSVAGGWHTHLGLLADRLNGLAPRPFWATHAHVEAQYDKRLPADRHD